MPLPGKSFYYGWVIVVISLLNLLVLYGVWYSYSVFMVAFSKEFGWNRTTTSSIFSLFMVVIGLTGPLVGFGVDRLGSRRVLSCGALILAVGLFLCSRAKSIMSFYLSFGLIVGLGGECYWVGWKLSRHCQLVYAKKRVSCRDCYFWNRIGDVNLCPHRSSVGSEIRLA